MSAPLDLYKPARPVHVGVILMQGETEILDVAPIDMIHGLTKHFVEALGTNLPPHLAEQTVDFRFHWVTESGPAGPPARLTSNISLTPTDSFETCPPLDIVLIGAHGQQYTPNAAELAFVRKSWEDCSAFLTICGGISVALMAGGILDGKTATAPRFVLDMFRQRAPTTNWVEKRWARDGKLWTSGTFLNGTDLMYAFANEYWGGGDDTLVQYLAKVGAWPNRDVDYKDVPWAL